MPLKLYVNQKPNVEDDAVLNFMIPDIFKFSNKLFVQQLQEEIRELRLKLDLKDEAETSREHPGLYR